MKRKKRNFFKLETIIIGALVVAFFIWALTKIRIGERMSNFFADETPVEEVVVIDSFQLKLDELRPIYVTIDNLNMRTEPSLKSSVIKKLPLHERVYFTGIVSDSTMRINIGNVLADEPWVKVIHEDGTEGWLYGAGVHFYKSTNPNSVGIN